MQLTGGGYYWGATHCRLSQKEPENELKQGLEGA